MFNTRISIGTRGCCSSAAAAGQMEAMAATKNTAVRRNTVVKERRVELAKRRQQLRTQAVAGCSVLAAFSVTMSLLVKDVKGSSQHQLLDNRGNLLGFREAMVQLLKNE